MAVEIRELVIKALVVNDTDNASHRLQEPQTALQKEKLIQECVRQVLKIIHKSNNR